MDVGVMGYPHVRSLKPSIGFYHKGYNTATHTLLIQIYILCTYDSPHVFFLSIIPRMNAQSNLSIPILFIPIDGLAPFMDDGNPSLSLSRQANLYHCFILRPLMFLLLFSIASFSFSFPSSSCFHTDSNANRPRPALIACGC